MKRKRKSQLDRELEAIQEARAKEYAKNADVVTHVRMPCGTTWQQAIGWLDGLHAEVTKVHPRKVERITIQWAQAAEGFAITWEFEAGQRGHSPVGPAASRHGASVDEGMLWAVLHPKSGRFDGWYKYRTDAEYVREGFDRDFPNEVFTLLPSPSIYHPPKNKWLYYGDSKEWANEEPGYKERVLAAAELMRAG
jgi:hypothetical protein